jgi:hypothetical protein
VTDFYSLWVALKRNKCLFEESELRHKTRSIKRLMGETNNWCPTIETFPPIRFYFLITVNKCGLGMASFYEKMDKSIYQTAGATSTEF